MCPAALHLRPLTVDDLPDIMAIEMRTFLGDAWPESVYRRELDNPLASYHVLEMAHGEQGGAAGQPRGVLLGYAGFWVVDQEAHLMTIAINPEQQGCGLGEWLLLELMDQMEDQGAHACTLEVRVGNRKAQSLYHRLGFQVEGKRRRYYNDNGEDALIMTTPPFQSSEMQEVRARRRRVAGQRIQAFLALR